MSPLTILVELTMPQGDAAITPLRRHGNTHNHTQLLVSVHNPRGQARSNKLRVERNAIIITKSYTHARTHTDRRLSAMYFCLTHPLTYFCTESTDGRHECTVKAGELFLSTVVSVSVAMSVTACVCPSTLHSVTQSFAALRAGPGPFTVGKEGNKSLRCN